MERKKILFRAKDEMFRWNINAKLQLATTNQKNKTQSTSPLGD